MAPQFKPFIVAPPLTSCEPAYLVFGQGEPPYTISIIPTQGNLSSQLLETLPLQRNPGYFQWNVDFQPGANITFSLADRNNDYAFSDFRVVQEGETTSCGKNDYAKKNHSSSSIGGIVGGVIAAVLVILLILTFFLLRLRRKRRLAALPSHRNGSKTSLASDDMALASGPSGVRRAGTFNLHNVAFTEPSLDHLRSIDTPPSYEPAGSNSATAVMATGTGVSTRATDEIEEEPLPVGSNLASSGVQSRASRTSEDRRIGRVNSS